MTTKDKIARRELSLLERATEMSNVSKACRIMGYSRQQFYEIRRNYQTYGADGLIDRLPVTAVHVMNNDVLATFEAHEARIATVLSDNGREYCGRPDRHAYELFLQLQEIEHRTTKVRRPQSNGFVERLHRTLPDEHFRIMGRWKFYESIEEMQKDLDAYLALYNTKRPHQGRGMAGMTPAEVFVRCLPKPKKPKEEKMTEAA